jgi:hypothetical protein
LIRRRRGKRRPSGAPIPPKEGQPPAASDLRCNLRSIQRRTGLSKTDIVNRALTLYEFVDGRLAAGDEILVRDPATGSLELVRLL